MVPGRMRGTYREGAYGGVIKEMKKNTEQTRQETVMQINLFPYKE